MTPTDQGNGRTPQRRVGGAGAGREVERLLCSLSPGASP